MTPEDTDHLSNIDAEIAFYEAELDEAFADYNPFEEQLDEMPEYSISEAIDTPKEAIRTTEDESKFMAKILGTDDYDWDGFEDAFDAEVKRINESKNTVIEEPDAPIVPANVSLDDAINDLVKNLNDQQQIAAKATEGPVIVVAGAGAGKTNTLIHRVATLMLKGVQPGNIMVVTFTNAAATEIKERIKGMIGEMGEHVVAGTFHSIIFKEILQKNPQSPYLQSLYNDVSDLEIMDAKATESYIKAIIEDTQPPISLDIEENEWKAAHFIKEMGLARSDGIDQRQYERSIVPGDMNQAFKVATADIWKRYFALCCERNKIDFDDILIVARNLLKLEPSIAEHLSQNFRYLHLDEYQDTNYVQQEVMDSIAKYHQNIFVVGDEKQSIYKFRGAKIDVIMSFKKRYQNAKQIEISYNYRSNPEIIKFTNAVADCMPQKLSDGQLIAMSKNPPIAPKVVRFETDRDEARAIVDSIRRKLAQRVKPNDIAIIYRSRLGKNELEKRLVEEGIEYEIKGERGFYERAHVRDVVAMMKFLINPNDSDAATRAIGAMRFGASIDGYYKDADIRRRDELPPMNIRAYYKELSTYTHASGKDKGKPTKKAQAAKLFSEITEHIHAMIRDNEDPQEIKKAFVKYWDIFMRPGIKKVQLDKKDKSGKVEDDAKITDAYFIVDRFIQAMDMGKSAKEAINDIVLMIEDAEDKSGDTPKVQLMTMHASKGLEFKVVFMIANDYVSLDNLEEDPAEKEEERRVFYVGATRAESELILTCAHQRYIHKDRVQMMTSPFIEELVEHKYGLKINEFKYKDAHKAKTTGFGYKR